MLDNETGFRVPEADVGIMAEKLLLLLTDEALAARMANCARRFVSSRFDLGVCTRALETFYDSVYDDHVRASCAAI
jgi:glycosyltransferase involved in cell wall biosynthesis